MNNVTFGDENVGYYETVAGGAGAVSSRHLLLQCHISSSSGSCSGSSGSDSSSTSASTTTTTTATSSNSSSC